MPLPAVMSADREDYMRWCDVLFDSAKKFETIGADDLAKMYYAASSLCFEKALELGQTS